MVELDNLPIFLYIEIRKKRFDFNYMAISYA